MFSLPSEEINLDLLVIALIFVFFFFFTVTMIMLFSYEKLQCKHYEMARVSSEHLGYSTASLCQANWSIYIVIHFRHRFTKQAVSVI